MAVPPLYRDFATVADVEKMYDIEATVPDFGAYAQDFVLRSAAYREQAVAMLDVQFGPTLEETYDVFLPSGSEQHGTRPALFFVHGGYWRATTSKVWSYIAKGLTERGYVVAIENYALCPTVTIAEIMRQHRAAYAHFHTHLSAYGVDSNRIVIGGHSAGGHAVATLLTTDWAGDYALPAVPFAGALAVSSVVDLRPLRYTFLNSDLRLDASSAAELSLHDHIPDQAPPTVIAYGSRETPEFERQSAEYAAALDQRGHTVDLHRMDNNHFDILDTLADGQGLLAREVVRLFDMA
ncbi:alpha/beta hydrolase [Rhodococcus sp. 1R11]|uniref:alpha/beta hydrolase n=1 Tax=Rhodococcus sp. 1R11 TaxID=2559614 RepID=UPI001071EA55|nr:alpha/beta hydrolase [Rhodococcus sp. 1R11]TFI44824.1 alpha/beta hydrolase [Rhodococcus sp. 1R11]